MINTRPVFYTIAACTLVVGFMTKSIMMFCIFAAFAALIVVVGNIIEPKKKK